MNIIQFLLSVFSDKPEEKVITVAAPKAKSDKDAPNLFVGKIIDDGNIKCEVVAVDGEDFQAKILEIYWVRLGTYLDLGRTYPIEHHDNSEFFEQSMHIWEIDPIHMKRDTSQVLLFWEKGMGWTWDLDM